MNIGKHEAYPKYKDSGIGWLGEIPINWNPQRIKFLYKLGRGRVISEEELEDDGEFPVFSSQTKNNGCLGYISTYDFNCEQITWTTDGANAGTVFLRSGKHNCTNVCGTLQPKSKENKIKFFLYCLQYATQFYKRPDTNGAKIMNGEMAEIFVTLPSSTEQQKIAKFLDYETAKIDALIEKQQQLIALLQEKRQAVISHAVTKGLNPDAPMRDSGVEWLGEVPAHWTIAHVRHVFRSLDGERIPISAEERGASQGSYPYFGASGIIDHVDDYLFDEPLVSVCEDGWNLLLRTQPVARPVSGKVWVNNHAHVLRPNFGSPTTWSEMLELTPFALYVTGMRQPKLTADMLKKITLAYPPSEEEHAEIGRYIINIRQQYSELLLSCEQQIALLQERRTALISAAVTGKIDVRGWQLPASSSEGETP